jgi:hypothetical protein
MLTLPVSMAGLRPASATFFRFFFAAAARLGGFAAVCGASATAAAPSPVLQKLQSRHLQYCVARTQVWCHLRCKAGQRVICFERRPFTLQWFPAFSCLQNGAQVWYLKSPAMGEAHGVLLALVLAQSATSSSKPRIQNHKGIPPAGVGFGLWVRSRSSYCTDSAVPVQYSGRSKYG